MKKSYRMIIVLNLFFIIGCILSCSSLKTPTVHVNSGEIAGGYEYTYNGRRIYSFLGVPYASPPVQNYRFKVCIKNNLKFSYSR